MTRNFTIYKQEHEKGDVVSFSYFIEGIGVKVNGASPITLVFGCRREGVEIDIKNDLINSLNAEEAKERKYHYPVEGKFIESFKNGYSLAKKVYDMTDLLK